MFLSALSMSSCLPFFSLPLSLFLFLYVVDTRKNLVASQDCVSFDIMWPKLSSGPSTRPLSFLTSNGIMLYILTFCDVGRTQALTFALAQKYKSPLSRAKGVAQPFLLLAVKTPSAYLCFSVIFLNAAIEHPTCREPSSAIRTPCR